MAQKRRAIWHTTPPGPRTPKMAHSLITTYKTDQNNLNSSEKNDLEILRAIAIIYCLQARTITDLFPV